MTHDVPDSAARLRRRNRELSILNTIAEALNREIDLQQALQVALVQVADLLDLQTGWIWLNNEETGVPYLAVAHHLPPALADNPPTMEGDCYCLDTYRQGDLDGAANINVVTCTRLKNLVDGTDGLRYHASIPLYASDNRQLGVLNVASPDWRELSLADLRLLHTIGDLLSIAITRARLFAQSVELGAVQERNRLAREIHDTLAQGLAAITLHLETADALLEGRVLLEGSGPADERIRAEARIRKAVEQALLLARSNMEEARRSVLDLRAAPLEGRTLAEALAALGEALADRQPALTIEQHIVGAGQPLPARLEIGLYRIAQETLANVERHAGATNVRLELAITPGLVRLVIADDGAGFDPAHIPPGHWGLQGIRERVRLLAGVFTLQSSPGHGTRLSVEVPQ